MEVDWAAGACVSIRGLVEEWEGIRAAAVNVERIAVLPGLGAFRTVYRVQSPSGRLLHYLVADEDDGERILRRRQSP